MGGEILPILMRQCIGPVSPILLQTPAHVKGFGPSRNQFDRWPIGPVFLGHMALY